jgi:hypothetical protein
VLIWYNPEQLGNLHSHHLEGLWHISTAAGDFEEGPSN